MALPRDEEALLKAKRDAVELYNIIRRSSEILGFKDDPILAPHPFAPNPKVGVNNDAENAAVVGPGALRDDEDPIGAARSTGAPLHLSPAYVLRRPPQGLCW